MTASLSPALIYVPTPERDCAATRALAKEGVPYRVLLCEGPYDYGSYFTLAWNVARNQGLPFVVVEWDIVPWPGAVDRLLDCEEDWCAHRYPVGDNITTSFGIGKYRPRGDAPDHWARTEWQMLDGQVVPVLRERFGEVHVHEPPVAHAQPPREEPPPFREGPYPIRELG